MINKVVENADVAIEDISDGAVLMLGGFGLCGIPKTVLMHYLKRVSRV
jgi:acyl CoA:acetate/3-ketoacid CoA transferase alpha subunit